MIVKTQRLGRIIFKLGPNPQILGKTSHRYSLLEERVLVTANSVRSGEYFHTYILSKRNGKCFRSSNHIVSAYNYKKQELNKTEIFGSQIYS